MNYKPLIIPKLNWNKGVMSPTYGELTVQPLESGYGTTLGNALRRVILSSIEGSTVTSVKINGVNNEFSTINGIVEDTLNVILNIRQIIIKNTTGLSGKMYLNCSGLGQVKVSDIKADGHLELINRDHVIANLAVDGNLEIEFFVDSGRGYVPAQWPQGSPLQQDNRIYIDALFSPITRIEYNVEKVRVGQEIDYDKLIFNVYTNGAVQPINAIHYGISILRSQLENFLETTEIPFNEISKEYNQTNENEEQNNNRLNPTKGMAIDLFLKPIEELEFSVRAHNCLVSAGIRRVIDLVNLAEEDVLKIKNFGRKSLREVKEILTAFDLYFGMNIKELDLKKAVKEQERRGDQQ